MDGESHKTEAEITWKLELLVLGLLFKHKLGPGFILESLSVSGKSKPRFVLSLKV